jgi:hypothetical protein
VDAALDLALEAGPEASVDAADSDHQPADAPPSRPDGRPNPGQGCTTDWDCTSGLTCDTAQPGGMCTRSCKVEADCDQKRTKCHEGSCHLLCNPRSIVNPCRDKYVCRVSGSKAVCVADCRVVKCGTGLVCDGNSGLCVDTSSGTIGAICGVKEGGCDGTPNGVCYTLSTLSKGFCTVPCAPFTKPCPAKIVGAQCVLGSATAPYCAFTCDPKAPKCPNAQLSCQNLYKKVYVCLPSK